MAWTKTTLALQGPNCHILANLLLFILLLLKSTTSRMKTFAFSGLLKAVPCPKLTNSIDCPETSPRNYNYSLRNNPEERSFLLRG
jgi:hypothetical protein